MNQEDEKKIATSYEATISNDDRRGYGWCKYELFGWHIWTIKGGWICAKLEDNHFTKHNKKETLTEAFEYACQEQ